MNARCAECGMTLPDAAVYHPYLYCVIWKAMHRDPAAVLYEHGFRREPVSSEETPQP